jgi:DNA-binding response OmpR family regulator
MNFEGNKIFINKHNIPVSPIEFRILQLLFLSIGKVIPRDNIVESVWLNQKVSSRLLDPHILSLRRKLRDYNYVIVSIYGKGYVLKKMN